MFLLDLFMIVWTYASNRWLYEIVRHEFPVDHKRVRKQTHNVEQFKN